MARPKSASHELKRDEILDIAAQCFADASYPATSMNTIAAAGGTSKARLYHYYDSKEAILFDLLDRYTQHLLALIGESQAVAERGNLDDRASLHALIKRFLQEYETSATRHVALLSDTKFLGEEQRTLIVSRQRDIVAAFTRFLKRAYPDRLTATNQTAITMMLFGMINWTFTWLRPAGALSYEAFADEVVRLLESGLIGVRTQLKCLCYFAPFNGLGVGKLAPRFALDVANLPTPNPLNCGSLGAKQNHRQSSFSQTPKSGDINDHQSLRQPSRFDR